MMTCLLLRDFAAAVERQQCPALAGVPLVILRGDSRSRVVAVDALARQAGVQFGMSVTQAAGLCPGAVLLPERESVYRRVLDDLIEHLSDCAGKVEPEYQPTSTAVYLDAAEAPDLLRRVVTSVTGITPGIGLAAAKFPARVAAAQAVWHGTAVKLSAGEEAAFLYPFPVTLLPLSKDMARRLPLLGIRTLGQYAALPGSAVWEQFGKHGRWLHDLARGVDIRPIQSRIPKRRLTQVHRLEDALSDGQILRHLLARLAARLVEGLRGEEAHHTTLLLRQENSIPLETHGTTPIHTLPVLMRQVEALMGKLPVTCGVAGVELRLSDIRPRLPVQLALFPDMDSTTRVEDYLPGWMERHQTIPFLRAVDAGDHVLPERRLELHRIQAG